MRHLSYVQICQFYSECHNPSMSSGTHAMRWAEKMEQMLGPDDCKGFIIRGREGISSGFYLMGNHSWANFPNSAKILSWGETAVRITNNPKLEAIRIGHDNIARPHKGEPFTMFGKDKDG